MSGSNWDEAEGYLDVGRLEGKEWEKIKEIIEPNPVRVKEIIDGKLAIDINEKNQCNLTWYSVFLYYLSCKEKQRKSIELWFKGEIKKRNFVLRI